MSVSNLKMKTESEIKQLVAEAVQGSKDALEEIVRRRKVRDLDWSQVARMFDPVWPRSGLLSGEGAAEWLVSRDRFVPGCCVSQLTN